MLAASEEERPFLADENSRDLEKGSKDSGDSKKIRSFSLHGILCILQLALLFLNISLFSLVYTSSRVSAIDGVDSLDFEKAFSPARSAIQYTVEILGYESSPFTGEPRPELDQAWSNLLRSTMVKITEDEMIRMNKTSIAFRDGTGYLGYLEAHHMLHCVKRLYQFQYQDHYPELKEDGSFSIHHRKHCLEVLRQGIMCNADVSVNSFFWQSESKIKGDRSGPRKCTDWNRLQAWADERTVQFSEADNFLDTLVQMDEEGSIGPTAAVTVL